MVILRGDWRRFTGFRSRGVGFVRVVLLAGTLSALPACGPAPGEGGEAATLSVSATLGGAPEEGFLRAVEPRPFSFPADHGPHPGYRNEWWYFTGNLTADDGREMGYQLTLFRTELRPPDAAAAVAAEGSAWDTRVVWMGHLAVTDARAGLHHETERFTRGALGLAGAEAEPLRVWMEDWEIRLDGPAATDPAALGPLRIRARGRAGAAGRAAGDSLGLDLRLEALGPPVLQGEDGLSQKGPEPGNASYYYSIPRLSTSGTLTVSGRTHEVRGDSWLDREWSTSALSSGVEGWDWFALRLSDGEDFMLYNLRREDGSLTPFSRGVWMPRGGEPRPVPRDSFEMEVLERWTSPLDGSSYPSRWRLTIPGEDVALDIAPILPDQEMDLAFRYWEGAVRVRGRKGDTPVEGRGYVELTGYAGSAAPGER